MPCNVGHTERQVRFAVAGLLAAAGAATDNRTARSVLLALAAINALTAAARYCPLNQALGRGSCDV